MYIRFYKNRETPTNMPMVRAYSWKATVDSRTERRRVMQLMLGNVMKQYHQTAAN